MEIEHNQEIAEYFEKAKEKLSNQYFVHKYTKQKIPNVLSGKIVRLEDYPYDTYIFAIDSIIPNFAWYPAFVWGVPALWLNGWQITPWLIPSLVFLLLSFFWSSVFFFMMQKRTIRKLGYKGLIKQIGKDECIKRLISKLHMQPYNECAK